MMLNLLMIKVVEWLRGNRTSPMTQEEFNAYVKDKGYADGGRAGFAGGGMGRRGFLKLLAGAGAGITALKSGFIGMGKKAAPIKKVAETAAGSGNPPPYFFKLVEKIKMLGDDAPGLATLDRQNVKKYKDYELTEDVSTGEIQIMKSGQSDEALERFAGENANEEVFMRYKPSEKILLDESNPGGEFVKHCLSMKQTLHILLTTEEIQVKF